MRDRTGDARHRSSPLAPIPAVGKLRGSAAQPIVRRRDWTGRGITDGEPEERALPSPMCAITAKIGRAVGESRPTPRQRYEQRAQGRLGSKALEYAEREKAVPSVARLRVSSMSSHDPAVNASIPVLLRQNGVMAIPVPTAIPDCARIRRPSKKSSGATASRFMRAAHTVPGRCEECLSTSGLASFGCGPGSSFSEQVFQAMLQGYPHTILESDGHGGSRWLCHPYPVVPAISPTVRRRGSGDDSVPDNSKLLSYVDPVTKRTGAYMDPDVRYVTS